MCETKISLFAKFMGWFQCLIWPALMMVSLQERSLNSLFMMSTTNFHIWLTDWFWKLPICSMSPTWNFDESTFAEVHNSLPCLEVHCDREEKIIHLGTSMRTTRAGPSFDSATQYAKMLSVGDQEKSLMSETLMLFLSNNPKD